MLGCWVSTAIFICYCFMVLEVILHETHCTGYLFTIWVLMPKWSTVVIKLFIFQGSPMTFFTKKPSRLLIYKNILPLCLLTERTLTIKSPPYRRWISLHFPQNNYYNIKVHSNSHIKTHNHLAHPVPPHPFPPKGKDLLFNVV